MTLGTLVLAVLVVGPWAPPSKKFRELSLEHSPERPLTVAQVYNLADAVGPRYRALILLLTFASLRWSELAALRKEDIDLDACTVWVTRQIYYLRGGVTPSARPSRRPESGS